MYSTKFKYVMFLLAAILDWHQAEARCVEGSKSSATDQRRFIMSRVGHYVELDCCHDNDAQIVWSKFNNETKQWEQYVPSSDASIYDGGKVLAIKSATFSDIGIYRCITDVDMNGTPEVTEYSVDVIACDSLARGPYVTAPLACPVTPARVGDVLTLPCAGYFGCGDADDDDERIVLWYVSSTENPEWTDAVSFDTRYQQTNFKRDDGTVLGSNLTIHGVASEDYDRNFMCILATPQIYRGQSKVFVKLTRDHVDSLHEASMFTWTLFLGICVSIAVIAVAIIVIRLSYRIFTRQKHHKEYDVNTESKLLKKGAKDKSSV